MHYTLPKTTGKFSKAELTSSEVHGKRLNKRRRRKIWVHCLAYKTIGKCSKDECSCAITCLQCTTRGGAKSGNHNDRRRPNTFQNFCKKYFGTFVINYLFFSFCCKVIFPENAATHYTVHTTRGGCSDAECSSSALQFKSVQSVVKLGAAVQWLGCSALQSE